jgi:hypothetical protein
MLTIAILLIYSKVGSPQTRSSWGNSVALVSAILGFMGLSDGLGKLRMGNWAASTYGVTAYEANKIFIISTSVSLIMLLVALVMSLQGEDKYLLYILTGGLLVYGIGMSELINYGNAFLRIEKNQPLPSQQV